MVVFNLPATEVDTIPIGTNMPHPAAEKKFPLTYHEYVLFPKDRNRHEILEGEPFATPSPKFLHQKFPTV